MTVPHRGKRRGEHDSLDARVPRSPEHAQRALARRNDDLVLLLRNGGRERRRDVQHPLAALDGLLPAFVLLEVRRDEGEAPVGLRSVGGEKGPDLTLPLRVPYRGADFIVRLQQLQQGVTSDEAGSTGHENSGHRSLLPVLGPGLLRAGLPVDAGRERAPARYGRSNISRSNPLSSSMSCMICSDQPSPSTSPSQFDWV